jgi:predicted metalloendopeptidase
MSLAVYAGFFNHLFDFASVTFSIVIYLSQNKIAFNSTMTQAIISKLVFRYSNYGGIGMVIGHEITHGFDNNGRQYDKDGNFKQWWTQKSIDNFKKKAQCIIDQYSDYVMPENGRNLNGQQTQGENIADNGGLRESYKAYMDNIPKQPRLPGVDFTEEQMFFLSFSQIWCSVFKPEGVDDYIDNGVHSPGRYRVIGTLQNNEVFNDAFNCPPGSYMNRDVKCKIWY